MQYTGVSPCFAGDSWIFFSVYYTKSNAQTQLTASPSPCSLLWTGSPIFTVHRCAKRHARLAVMYVGLSITFVCYIETAKVIIKLFLGLVVSSLHCALSLAAQCIVIGPVCGFVCVCLCVCGSVTTVTRNCVHRSSPSAQCLRLLWALFFIIIFWSPCTDIKFEDNTLNRVEIDVGREKLAVFGQYLWER